MTRETTDNTESSLGMPGSGTRRVKIVPSSTTISSSAAPAYDLDALDCEPRSSMLMQALSLRPTPTTIQRPRRRARLRVNPQRSAAIAPVRAGAHDRPPRCTRSPNDPPSESVWSAPVWQLKTVPRDRDTCYRVCAHARGSEHPLQFTAQQHTCAVRSRESSFHLRPQTIHTAVLHTLYDTVRH